MPRLMVIRKDKMMPVHQNKNPQTPRPDVTPASQAVCQHHFVFLRQETRNEGYERNSVWAVYDIFFCENCLEYRKRQVDPCYREYANSNGWELNR